MFRPWKPRAERFVPKVTISVAQIGRDLVITGTATGFEPFTGGSVIVTDPLGTLHYVSPGSGYFDGHGQAHYTVSIPCGIPGVVTFEFTDDAGDFTASASASACLPPCSD